MGPTDPMPACGVTVGVFSLVGSGASVGRRRVAVGGIGVGVAVGGTSVGVAVGGIGVGVDCGVAVTTMIIGVGVDCGVAVGGTGVGAGCGVAVATMTIGVGLAAGAPHPTKSNITNVTPIICCGNFW
jgi:hypothetical protein